MNGVFVMDAVNQFKQLGYVIIKNLVSSDEVSRLYQYTLTNMGKGNLDDGQVPGSPSFYQDKEVAALQKTLMPEIEKKIQTALTPVFCYHRIYRTGAVLRMHKDSPRAEISVTINLGQQGGPWSLWLVDYNENTVQATLMPGDALVYHGNKLFHWRGKLEHADLVAQIMFHCVDRNGKNGFSAKLEFVRRIRKRFREIMGISY